MKNLIIILVVAAIAAVAFAIIRTDAGPMQVLIFSNTASFRHESIEAGIEAIKEMAEANSFEVTATEDASIFQQKDLKDFQVVVFLNTTGDILDDNQQAEMERWVQAGGGFVGIHSAADTEYDWPWYGKLVGAYFESHPNNPNVLDATIDKVDPDHPSTQHLPQQWTRTDEWYNYKDIFNDIKVLLNLDENSYEGGTNGEYHPIAWYHEYDGGRSWYTGGGHTIESFAEPDFIEHLLQGIKWAAGSGKPVDYSRNTVAPEANRFQKVVLEDHLNEPMELVMLPDRRILFVERRGDIRVFDPGVGKSEVVAHLDVHSVHEDGLLGVALDPDFESNHWLYLFYSPVGEDPVQHVSRFEFKDDSLHEESEKVLLVIDVQRDECCHSAGSLEFGPDGNLFISVGDNTNPHASSGYAPIDERPGRGPWDAQKSSSNTNDLRGKVLRITPLADGTYEIPEGNLFAKDGSEGRAEIYAMGCRNPYRISIDPHTKYLYWGDVGPDGGNDSIGRGPKGHDEVNQARAAGFFGWPYFVGDNKPYTDFDFATETSGAEYDAAKPENHSPNNTGATTLPPAQPAFIWYPYARSPEFPLVGEGGRNAMAGPVFYQADYPDNARRYPAYFDGKLFIYDWMRGWIMTVIMDQEGHFRSMKRFMPDEKFNNPNDMIMSPDGDIFLLEYGTGWFVANPDARLVQLKYHSGNRQPIARFEASASEGAVPFEVTFDSKRTSDPDGDELKFQWDFGDGNTSKEPNPVHVFSKPGVFDVVLTVTDKDKQINTYSTKIYSGNEPPAVSWDLQGNKSFFWPGQSVDYTVNVSDQEDGQGGGGISEDQIAVTISHLSEGTDMTIVAQGHEALAGSAKLLEGKSLMDNSDCKACHFDNAKSVGPSYQDIAQRYKGKADATEYLVDKILVGGGGVWGETAMAAHPQHTEDEAAKMADYILSLTEEKQPEESLPLSGSYTFSEESGSYILMASYTDQGAEGAQPLTGRDVITLRAPIIDAANFDEIDKAMRFEVKADQMAMLGFKEDRFVVIATHEGSVGYHDIDLSGIKGISAQVILAPQFTVGGKIDMFVGGIDGELIGTIEVPFENMGLQLFTAPIEAKEGMHDLHLKFSGTGEGMMGILLGLQFHQSLPNI